MRTLQNRDLHTESMHPSSFVIGVMRQGRVLQSKLRAENSDLIIMHPTLQPTKWGLTHMTMMFNHQSEDPTKWGLTHGNYTPQSFFIGVFSICK